MDWEELRILEERVEKVLEAYRRLKAKNEEISELLRQQTEELTRLKEENEGLKKEKEEVRLKVEQILGRLESVPFD